MADCLEIVFSSFWTWLGSVVLMVAFSSGLGAGLHLFRNMKED